MDLSFYDFQSTQLLNSQLPLIAIQLIAIELIAIENRASKASNIMQHTQ